MSSHTPLKELIDTAPVRQVPLFPDDVVRIMESGTASEREVTSFEIQAVCRGLREPGRWKQRDDHYESLCWCMGEREYQCQWYPDGNYLVFSERTSHTARACGWKPDEMVTFTHSPERMCLSDIVAREEGSLPIHPIPNIEEQGENATDACATRQYKLHLDTNGSLGAVARHVTKLMLWWLLEVFEISERKTSILYGDNFMDVVDQRVRNSSIQ